MSSILQKSIFKNTLGIPYSQWRTAAENHANIMNDMLYPYKEICDWKQRFHAVSEHPIYNFLHNYYRYSPLELKLYSPGMGYSLEDVSISDLPYIHKFITPLTDTATYYVLPTASVLKSKRYSVKTVTNIRDILYATCQKSPHFACFGLHEWAMLYSDNQSQALDPNQRHQSQLKLRVSQSTIDDVVQQTPMSCTHFDAWRFFHPAAQPLNALHPLTRHDQVQNEQPGCIHATMDLFRYTYELYPFTSAELLQQSLSIALIARKIDMRASPYDVSHIEGCEDTICIETNEGKLKYIQEQQQLYTMSYPLRQQLLEVYNKYLSYINQLTDTE